MEAKLFSGLVFAVVAASAIMHGLRLESSSERREMSTCTTSPWDSDDRVPADRTTGETGIQWVYRNVEPTIEKWMRTPGAVMLVRGDRRSGKSSTVVRVASRLQKVVKHIYISADNDTVFESARSVQLNVSSIYDFGMVVIHAVKSGFVVILDEIQNSSPAMRVSLQRGIDQLAHNSLWAPTEWKRSGALFLMGSIPSEVDNLIEHRSSALFQRVISKITILPFDTAEILRLYRREGITNPTLMLNLHALLGGKPHLYQVVNIAGLLKGNNTNMSEVQKELFASELQSQHNDCEGYLIQQLGKPLQLGVRAVSEKHAKDKGEQLSLLKRYLGEIGLHEEPFTLLNDLLYKRYGVIRPVMSISNLNKCSKFVIADPFLAYSLAISAGQSSGEWKREDTWLAVGNSSERAEEIVAFHFKRWLTEIMQDRYLLLRKQPIPKIFDQHTETLVPTFLPSLNWDLKGLTVGVEIDIIVGFPSIHTVVVGSCKLSTTQTDRAGLRRHWESFKYIETEGVGASTPESTAVDSCVPSPGKSKSQVAKSRYRSQFCAAMAHLEFDIKNLDTLKAVFVHFCPEGDGEHPEASEDRIIGLNDFFADFA
jgi:hypothetical protein